MGEGGSAARFFRFSRRKDIIGADVPMQFAAAGQAQAGSARRQWSGQMIFRQLFDSVSGTYTYLIASRRGGEALIIDPVLEKVDRYMQLIRELDLKLVKAVDTHLHADHITGLGALRDQTHCITVMGEQTKADVVAMRVAEGDRVGIEGLSLDVLYTPGHTDDSYSYLMGDRIFTGDTLLIRGTGRTDFQNGDPRAQYDSIFNKLLRLPEETLLFPAHDYKGDTVSTIGEEKRFNPRLQVKSVDEYVDLMNNLHLPNPKMMDVAVPANIHIGLHQEEIARKGWAVSAKEALGLRGRADVVIVDLRERAERERHGVIPGALHAPYADLQENLSAGGMLHELAVATGKRVVFYCAFGERSAMAVQAAQDAGVGSACHIEGGIDAWKKAGGVVGE
ncbi:glyoxylase-like metal-dependent hydrolase (beta-lactamase superfamily II)/rhodanese-related sulfurtransferase [Rhizobium sp. BK275]|nr:glyoxylase-like metal-dependent hydrolase (beta-lactamase superfamily II)/rhodanese-related sulfurtransferase [Rhizobium sp. BK275]